MSGTPRTTVVALEAAADAFDVPIGALTHRLADAVVTLFHDRVVVLCLRPAGAPMGDTGAHIESVELADEADRAEAVVRARLDHCAAQGVRYVFVDRTALEPTAHPWLAGLVTRRVVLTRDVDQPFADHACKQSLCTVLLATHPDRAPLARAPLRFRRTLGRVARELLLGEQPSAGEGMPYGEQDAAPGPWCRVRLDLEAVVRAPSFVALPTETRDAFGRWARALTHRRVGLALGGSGAWGYASVALMLELSARGIPIDLVAGASSGALMGAYYCAAGTDGLERLIANGPAFAWGLPLMALSSSVAQHALDDDLGGRLLTDLDVPLLPVATSLTHLRPEVIVRGTVGFGVRASASAPGIFAPTDVHGRTWVDGAVTDNVPVGLVERMGADLVIATNPLPAANVRAQSGDGPLRRLGDFARAFDLMLHTAGERTPGDRRVVYSAGPALAPLRATFRYASAAVIVDGVRRADPRFSETIAACERLWQALS